ncbi:hypothetical protein KUCAC02_036105 [Chaenocephalus aceratus]|nr:hypothetical protein KUCAC02_036105 [Chaenocephalus aceratus]
MAYWYCQCRNTSLNKMVAGHPKRWDQVLSVHHVWSWDQKTADHKVQPYYLVFGREASNSTVWTGRRTQTLWCKFGPSEVYSENIMDLAPGKWLEGEFVNSYVTMVGRKAGALLIDSYLMTSLSGRETTKIMYLKERRSLFVDPFGATDAQIDRCKDDRSIGPAIGRWECSSVAHPKQKGLIMWGVCVQDDLSQLCRAEGELSSLAEGDIDTWIECTTCNMWHHIGCVGLPSPTEEGYFCPSCKS